MPQTQPDQPDQLDQPDRPGRTQPVRRISRGGLAWRSAVLIAGTLLVINGSAFGNDVYWPFGPMSQFAFRTGTNDVIRSTFLAGVDEDGMLQRVSISRNNLGIARAEIEGQQPRFVREPDLMADLAANYHRIHPDAPQLTQLWLCQEITQLHKGREAGTSEATVVGWPRNTLVPATLPAAGNEKVAVDLQAPENNRENTNTTSESGQEGRK